MKKPQHRAILREWRKDREKDFIREIILDDKRLVELEEKDNNEE